MLRYLCQKKDSITYGRLRQRIESQIAQLSEFMQQNITVIQQDITGMKQDITVIQQDITGMKQDITVIQQDMTGMKQDISATKQNVNAVREDLISLRQRVDSNEGGLIVALREGFKSQETIANDLNYDLWINERKTRRLSRRVSRLERKSEDE